MTEVITTERLVLRRFRRSDSARLIALLNDLDVVRWLTVVPHPYDAEDAADFIGSLADKQNAFAVTRDDALIGCVSIGNQLGYWIGKPYWGQGYVTEAARAVTDRYFGAGHAQLTSGYHLGNERSQAVLTKLGFQPDGQHHGTVRATYEDVIIQDVILKRSVWEAEQ